MLLTDYFTSLQSPLFCQVFKILVWWLSGLSLKHFWNSILSCHILHHLWFHFGKTTLGYGFLWVPALHLICSYCFSNSYKNWDHKWFNTVFVFFKYPLQLLFLTVASVPNHINIGSLMNDKLHAKMSFLLYSRKYYFIWKSSAHFGTTYVKRMSSFKFHPLFTANFNQTHHYCVTVVDRTDELCMTQATTSVGMW